MPHVLVAGTIHAAGLDLLRAAADVTFEVVDEVSLASYRPRLPAADAVILRTQPMPAEAIATANRLQIVSRHGVGFDAVDAGALTARGIPLTVVGDVNSRTVAEHAMALILGLAKHVVDHDAKLRAGGWAFRNRFEGTELWGKTLLIVGFGRIGRLVAGMAGAFGMTILAFDPFLDAAAVRSAGADAVADLADGLARADYVTLHLPKSGSEPLIGPDALARMKPGARLVNTARGGLVDEAALARALSEGRLAGAGIDVFEEEPPPPSLALLSAPNTILTPHTAGLTQECAIRMGQRSVQNVLDYFAGRLDPAYVVNGVAV